MNSRLLCKIAGLAILIGISLIWAQSPSDSTSPDLQTGQQLAQLEEQLRLKDSLLKDLDFAQKHQIQQLANVQSEQNTLTLRIKKQRQFLILRIQRLYRQSIQPLPFWSQHSGSFWNSWLMWKKIIHQDLEQIRNYRLQLNQWRNLAQKVVQTLHLIQSQKASSLQIQSQIHSHLQQEQGLFSQAQAQGSTPVIDLYKHSVDQRNLNQIVDRITDRQDDAHPATYWVAPRTGRYCPPLRGPILSKYGPTRDIKLETETFNTGVEIGSSPGTAILAARDGEVVSLSQQEGWGQTLIISHPGGYYSVYAQIEHVRVHQGQNVGGCEIIAEVAHTPKPHLSFHLYRDKQHTDPSNWLKGLP